ncbi:MAG: FHA domain-containing protein [Lentisphaerae bacterium]|nr:FHA domain-containing protein [Lentisphaerota bacterium]
MAGVPKLIILSEQFRGKKKGGTYILKDCGSTNGTRINNIPITGEQDLQSSDILQVGGVEILYDCEDKTVTTALKTQTGINLQGAQVGISTIKEMTNFSPFASDKKKNAKNQKIMIIFVIILILVIVALLAYLSKIMLKSTSQPHTDISRQIEKVV